MLNQPITIWVLSTVVVGAASLVYSEAKERRQRESLSYKQELVVSREIAFRVEQYSKLIAYHDEASSEVSKINDYDGVIGDDGIITENGKAVQRYFRTAILLAVAADLGGIGSFPLAGKSVYGYDNSTLPSGRGYQNDEFKNLSIEDLWVEYHLIIQERVEVEHIALRESLDVFERATNPSDEIESINIWGAPEIKRWASRSDRDDTVVAVREWVSEIKQAWRNLSREIAVGQYFEGERSDEA